MDFALESGDESPHSEWSLDQIDFGDRSYGVGGPTFFFNASVQAVKSASLLKHRRGYALKVMRDW